MNTTEERIGIFVIYSDGTHAVAFCGAQVVASGTPDAVRAYCTTPR